MTRDSAPKGRKDGPRRGKPLPVVLDRLLHVLQRSFPKAKPRRSDALAIAAYAFGHRNQNELAAAAAAGDLDVEPVEVAAVTAAYAYLRDRRANAVFALETAFVERVCVEERRERFVVSPYGNLVDLTPAFEAAVGDVGDGDGRDAPSGDRPARGRERLDPPVEVDAAWLEAHAPGWRAPIPLRGGGTARLWLASRALHASIDFGKAEDEDWLQLSAERGWHARDADEARGLWAAEHRFVFAEMSSRFGVGGSGPGDVHVSPSWAARAASGPGLLASVSEALGMRCIATFRPQARIDGDAVEVDAEGEASFDATDSFHEAARERRDDLHDGLADDGRAPKWIREWQGPFDVIASTTHEAWLDALARAPGL